MQTSHLFWKFKKKMASGLCLDPTKTCYFLRKLGILSIRYTLVSGRLLFRKFLSRFFAVNHATCLPQTGKLYNTGWSISILYTLTGWYGNNNKCMKKIMVYIFSVYPDISFDNKKLEKITEISFHNRNNRNNNYNRNIL